MMRIIGGGLWGGLLAWFLHQKRQDVEFVLYEKSDRLGGNHTWSFHKSDLTPEMFALISPFVSTSWTSYDVKFPSYQKQIPLEYCSIKSEDFDRVIRATIPGRKIKLETDGIRESDDLTFDMRGKAFTSPCGYQKFVGLECEFDDHHGFTRPVLMDATVEQIDGFRFIYVLPFTEKTLLIEDTRYSSHPSIDYFRMKEKIHAFLNERGLKPISIIREESGSLPIPFSTSTRIFAGPVISLHHIFHDTTGYSLPDAVRIFSRLIESDLTETSINKILNEYVSSKKKDRDFFTLLNRLMFQASDAHERYKPLEFFYRSQPGLISKFYSGDMNLLDKAKFFAGRPPVNVIKALNVLREVHHE